MNKTYWKTCACIFAGFLFTSCADEGLGGADAPQSLKCAIGVRGAATGPSAGAQIGTYPADELIQWYDVVFVEGEKRDDKGALQTPGTVRALVHKDLNGAAVASDEFTTQLGPGEYTVYAFGNLYPAYFSSLGIAEGQPMPDLDNKSYPSASGDGALADVPAATNGYSGPIPMSRRQDGVQVADRANQHFAIELVRMFAAMRFVFTNYASAPLTVEAVTMSPLTEGDIYLIRNPQEGVAPELPADAGIEDFIHTVGLTLPADSAKQGSTAFYLKECSAIGHHPSDRFALTFRVSHGAAADEGGAATAAERLRGGTTEYRYALTGDGLAYINRNDLVILPIGFIDYVFSADVNFYPPIGGYPAAEIVQDASDAFSCTFRSPGDFAIHPRLRNTAGTGEWISVWDKSRVDSFEFSVTDGDGNRLTDANKGIFDRIPTEQGGEIVGTLGSQTGKACITLTVTLKPEAPATVGRVLTCRIYIIRTNA